MFIEFVLILRFYKYINNKIFHIHMLERKEVPSNIDNVSVCEVCGAVLITVQERVLRRCPNHILK